MFEDVKWLYERGSRNFLFLDVLPGDRMSSIEGLRRQKDSATVARNIRSWNERLQHNVTRFGANNEDASVFLFSAHGVATSLVEELETSARDDPCEVQGELWFSCAELLRKLNASLAKTILLTI